MLHKRDCARQTKKRQIMHDNSLYSAMWERTMWTLGVILEFLSVRLCLKELILFLKSGSMCCPKNKPFLLNQSCVRPS